MRYSPLLCASVLLVPGLGALAASHSQASETAKISISRIDVQSPVKLTPAEHQAFIAKLHSIGWNFSQEQTIKFTQDMAGEIVKEAYQDNGYFMAEVSSDIVVDRRLGGTSNVLVLHVKPGKRYRVTGISWHGISAFPETELARLIPIRPGEFFSRKKFAHGLEAAKTLYDSHGYINYSPIPQPQVDEEAGTLGWVIEVDEGGQFRFGELDVQGIEQAHRQILLSAWQGLQGRPYNAKDADEFFNRYFRSPRPHVSPENYAVRRIDEAKRTVNYSLQFVPWIRYRITKSSRLEKVENP